MTESKHFRISERPIVRMEMARGHVHDFILRWRMRIGYRLGQRGRIGFVLFGYTDSGLPWRERVEAVRRVR